MISFKTHGGKILHKNKHNVPYSDSNVLEWYDFEFLSKNKQLEHVYEYALSYNGALIGATQMWGDSGKPLHILSNNKNSTGHTTFSLVNGSLLSDCFNDDSCENCGVIYAENNSYTAECTHKQCYKCATRVNHLCTVCGSRLYDKHLISRIISKEYISMKIRKLRQLGLSWGSIRSMLLIKYNTIYNYDEKTGKLISIFNNTTDVSLLV